MKGNEITVLCVSTALLVLVFVVLGLFGVLELSNKIDTSQLIQIIITFVLVLVTVAYVKRTADIAKATKQQADASVKMAEVASRPYIIQRAMFNSTTPGSPPDFDYFEIYNAGNGPAIEVEISAFDKEKKRRSSQKRSFLQGSNSIEFRLEWDLTTYVGSTCYLVSEYRNIYSYGSQTWYQTWLPFHIEQIQGTNKIILLSGDLEFREVSAKERIDAFSKRSEPK